MIESIKLPACDVTNDLLIYCNGTLLPVKRMKTHYSEGQASVGYEELWVCSLCGREVK